VGRGGENSQPREQAKTCRKKEKAPGAADNGIQGTEKRQEKPKEEKTDVEKVEAGELARHPQKTARGVPPSIEKIRGGKNDGKTRNRPLQQRESAARQKGRGRAISQGIERAWSGNDGRKRSKGIDKKKKGRSWGCPEKY